MLDKLGEIRNKFSLSLQVLCCLVHTLIIYSQMFFSQTFSLLALPSYQLLFSSNFLALSYVCSVHPASMEALLGACCLHLISNLARQGSCQRRCWCRKGTSNYSRSRAATSPAGDTESVCVEGIVNSE